MKKRNYLAWQVITQWFANLGRNAQKTKLDFTTALQIGRFFGGNTQAKKNPEIYYRIPINATIRPARSPSRLCE